MAKTANTGKLAKINKPAPKAARSKSRDGLPPDRRTLTPTPSDVKRRDPSRDDRDEPEAGSARKEGADSGDTAKDKERRGNGA